MNSHSSGSCYAPGLALSALRRQWQHSKPGFVHLLLALGRGLSAALTDRERLPIHQRTCYRQRCWVVYDRATQQHRRLFSEADLRAWLEHCYRQ